MISMDEYKRMRREKNRNITTIRISATNGQQVSECLVWVTDHKLTDGIVEGSDFSSSGDSSKSVDKRCTSRKGSTGGHTDLSSTGRCRTAPGIRTVRETKV